MGQRGTKVSPMTVGEVYDQHLSTPPKPSTNTAVQHPHPRDETPAGAGGGEEGGGGGGGGGEGGEGEEGGGEGGVGKEGGGGGGGGGRESEGEKKEQEVVVEAALFLQSCQKTVSREQLSRYTVGDQLGKGGFGVVYEGTRLEDNLKVALKYVTKTEHMECIFIQIALTILANKGHRVPEIIRLLDWTDHPDHFVMVLECPSPCENLVEFIRRHRGSVDEETTRQIMWQAAHASHMCCLRRVYNRDVKLENLLINRETSEVKLIDFGCGDILGNSPYKSYHGTAVYSPPEYYSRGEYDGWPTTVWSLGIVMFTLLCGHFPSDYDLFLLQHKQWSKPGLSKECCDLLGVLLHVKPIRRLGLELSYRTTPVGVSHAALRLAGCSGRRFHPSSRLCVLRGE
ncbi:hypothetical protein G5714_023918 [Onychostoma macrolepis]|uniref:non-specific serine/threonine protein kinase n=1 Tax=Onychostoma macrolepis TaxID=369639 RepID=A0A7J6BI77_9TELE|nr:hypothetical protein G5714_023918 [Onychostoma macrolepis]